MAQQLLPIFPNDTVMITAHLGVKSVEEVVYYFHVGVPIYSHMEKEFNKFRFCTSNFIKQGLCRNVDIERSFSVSSDSVRRNKKKLMELGESAFFKDEKGVRKAHKLTPDKLLDIQQKLDKSKSVNSIAKGMGISEGAIRYAISMGRLKKSKSEFNHGCSSIR